MRTAVPAMVPMFIDQDMKASPGKSIRSDLGGAILRLPGPAVIPTSRVGSGEIGWMRASAARRCASISAEQALELGGCDGTRQYRYLRIRLEGARLRARRR